MADLFRLRFDVPHSFCEQPGYSFARHHADFAPGKDSFADTYREPVTDLVMLLPRFLDAPWYQDCVPLEQMRHREGQWETVKRPVIGLSPSCPSR